MGDGGNVDDLARDPIAIAQVESLAFEQLMAAELDASFRLAVAILGDRDEARDATQDAFIAAWRKLPGLRDPAKASAWVHRITVNNAISRLRRRTRDVAATSRLARTPATGAAAEDAVIRRESLRAALWQLNPDHRTVLFLRFYEDLTVEQIARRIGVREGTVKSRLHYGLERLRLVYDGGEETR